MRCQNIYRQSTNINKNTEVLNGNSVLIRWYERERCYSPWAIVHLCAHGSMGSFRRFDVFSFVAASDNNLMFKFKCSKWMVFQIPKINAPHCQLKLQWKCMRLYKCGSIVVYGSLFVFKFNLHTFHFSSLFETFGFAFQPNVSATLSGKAWCHWNLAENDKSMLFDMKKKVASQPPILTKAADSGPEKWNKWSTSLIH